MHCNCWQNSIAPSPRGYKDLRGVYPLMQFKLDVTSNLVGHRSNFRTHTECILRICGPTLLTCTDF